MSRCPLLGLMVSLLVLILSVGCADDLRQRTPFDGGAGDAMISFSVENISLTRSDANMESAIDHAYLLFYESGANPAYSVPKAAVRAEVSESNPSALTFKMPFSLIPDTDYKIIAVANADFYVPEGFSSFKDYVESWCRNASEDGEPLRLFHAGPLEGETVRFLPMGGGAVGDAAFRFSIHDGAYNVSASLSFRRKVARIDVANIVKDGFEVEGVALCNWRDAVSAVASESQLGNRLGSVRGILAEESADAAQKAFVDMPPTDENGVQQLRQAVYCFPSVSYEASASDRESTSLIIKARYGDDAESSYYRVNIGMTGSKSEVKSNTKYLVTIQSVKGRGASSPEEAYNADESQIILAVVEDWDLDGCFAMDENGNFIVLSTGHLKFEGDAVANKEVRILASRGLDWSVDYVADNAESESAFTATRLSDIALAVGTNGKNNGETSLSGKFVVSAETQDGNKLSVDIVVVQNPSMGSEYPDIPEEMPFALVPLSTDRVRIDQEKRTIEIDGFEPDCINSFIDIPFRLFIRQNQDIPSVNISSSLLWPLEGRIAIEKSCRFTYCNASFDTQGSGKVCDENGRLVEYSELYIGPITQRNDGDIIYISVGAMGPDDPAIQRQVTLSLDNQPPVTYQLKVSPRDAVIDDVIIADEDGNHWFIMDRNVQSYNDSNFSPYIGRDADGRKRQAYNYCGTLKLTIPFKYLSENVAFSEDFHALYRGVTSTYNHRTNAKDGMTVRRSNWLNKNKYDDSSEPLPRLYDKDNIDSWVFPDQKLMEICARKMKVSKMRLFLVSDIYAKKDNKTVPVCCYWPYLFLNDEPKESDGQRWGYFIAENGYPQTTPRSMVFIFYNGNKVVLYDWTVKDDDNGFARLVRSLTNDELDAYKANYLGYGSESLRLSICHPDSYTSEPFGWLSL